MLNFLDELKENYAKADKALGGILPGGGTPGPLTPAANAVKKDALKVRDNIVDAYEPPLHKDLFIKAHTGGASGDGVVRELPTHILGVIKTQVKKQKFLAEYDSNPENAKKKQAAIMEQLKNPSLTIKQKNELKNHLEYSKEAMKKGPPDTSRNKKGELALYGSGSAEANLGLGTIGVYFDKDGNVLIKDKWKVDKPFGRTKTYGDLGEGGQLASDIHNAALDLGIYKDIPIEVRLTKEEWERLHDPTEDYTREINKEDYKDAQDTAVRGSKFSKNVLR